MENQPTNSNYEECKYCGDSLLDAPELRQFVGVCELCEDLLFNTAKKKKKKKPTYNLG